MSCTNCTSTPYENLRKTWTPAGNLNQNNYTPPNGWPYDPKNVWPSDVVEVEGFCCKGMFAPSSNAWSRVSNITSDNFPGYSSYSISNAPAITFSEKFTQPSRVSPTNFATLKNTWRVSKPYSS